MYSMYSKYVQISIASMLIPGVLILRMKEKMSKSTKVIIERNKIMVMKMIPPRGLVIEINCQIYQTVMNKKWEGFR